MPDLPRLGLVLAVLALAGCGPSEMPPEMTPERALAAYESALDAGDPERAVDLLEMAADGGDLHALRALADAYDQGYVRGLRYRRGSLTNFPIRTSPNKATRTRWRYERALRRGAEQGDPESLFAAAQALLERDFEGGEWHDPTPADRDSAAALLRRLDALGADPLRRAVLAKQLDDGAGYRRRLAEAQEAGDPQACVWLFWDESRADAFSAAHTARSVDRHEACRALAPRDQRDRYDHAGRLVGTLHDEAAGGNAAAGALLDSLSRLGVFERHPRLAHADGPAAADA